MLALSPSAGGYWRLRPAVSYEQLVSLVILFPSFPLGKGRERVWSTDAERFVLRSWCTMSAVVTLNEVKGWFAQLLQQLALG